MSTIRGSFVPTNDWYIDHGWYIFSRKQEGDIKIRGSGKETEVSKGRGTIKDEIITFDRMWSRCNDIIFNYLNVKKQHRNINNYMRLYSLSKLNKVDEHWPMRI